MVLSQTATYALQALVTLAGLQPGERATVDELAEGLGRPRNYLSKILHQLASAGVLDSSRGPGGGFRLARPPEELRLIEVVRQFDDVPREPVCLLGWNRCSDDDPCPAHARWRTLSAPLADFFEQTSLADLVGDVH